MSGTYERPAAAAGGLRLHLNENTSGCSPRVLEAIEALGGEDMAFYPEYDEVVRETAAYVGVDHDWLLLVNGLDEGLLAATVAAVRPSVESRGGPRPEVLVPLPAFDMYGIFARATGATLVEVQPRADFTLQADELVAAVTPATRLVVITSPNNPTGVRVELSDIARVAGAVPEGALVFVDEAYHDFCGDSALPLAAMRTNVVVGRTFAKAHGLAALRAGCVIGPPATLDAMRLVVPPYSLNVCAAAGLRAALKDRERHAWYVEQVQQSRGLVYDFCERRGLDCWESGANFVLVRVGATSAAVVAALGARGIFVRDRSKDAGCRGCIRITAGVVEHTARCLAALEEILCGAA
jgi:histidinol-phosphate aminotransferase